MNEAPSVALVALGCTQHVLALYAQQVGRDSRLDALARVVRIDRTRTVAVGDEGRDLRVKSSISTAVGDWVVVCEGTIISVLPRQSVLERGDPERDRTRVLAANIDIVIVTAPADRLHLSRVERELALAWHSGAMPLVVLTKLDLAAPSALGELEAHCGGVRVLPISTRSGEGIDELAALLPGQTAVMLGPSGAGKSTLVNALMGFDVSATGTVREGDHRGRHTTTARQLVTLPGGGNLIDTPGIRALVLVGPLDENVFPEIEEVATRCRFGNCQHRQEPGCAVIVAIAAGQLEADRVASYSKLMNSGETRTSYRPRPPHGRASLRRAYEGSLDVDEDRRTR